MIRCFCFIPIYQGNTKFNQFVNEIFLSIRYHYSKSLMFSRISFSLYVVIRTWISGHKNVKFPNKLNHKFSHYNLYTHSTWALGEISTIKFIGCVWAHYFSKCKNVISWIVFRVVWHTYDENNNINKMLYAQKIEDAFAISNPFIRVLKFCIHCSREKMRRRLEFLWILNLNCIP